MTDQGDSLLREVDRDVRDERMAALWQQYRRPVMVGIAAIILGTFAATQWRDYREKQAGIALQEFSAAQQLFAAKKFDDAAPAFATIAAQHKGNELADIAHLWQARALLSANKNAEAMGAFADLAEHPQSRNLIWRDDACLRLVALDASKSACLGADDNSPLQPQRTLTRAALLWSQQKAPEAQTLLEGLINNTETPASVRESAKRYLSVIAPARPVEPLVKKGA